MLFHVVIIIPVFNEEQSLKSLLPELTDLFSLEHSSYQVSVLVFDSQSSDQSSFVAHSAMEKWDRIHLLQESSKTGLGSAYMQAMRYAIDHLNADAVVEYDADGSHQSKYLIPMIEAIVTDEADVVVALGVRIAGLLDVFVVAASAVIFVDGVVNTEGIVGRGSFVVAFCGCW